MLKTALTPTKTSGVPRRASEEEVPRVLPHCQAVLESGFGHWSLISMGSWVHGFMQGTCMSSELETATYFTLLMFLLLNCPNP